MIARNFFELQSDFEIREEAIRRQEYYSYVARIQAEKDAIIASKDDEIEKRILQGINSIIAMAKKLHGTKNDAVAGIMEEYDKSEAEARELVEKYW